MTTTTTSERITEIRRQRTELLRAVAARPAEPIEAGIARVAKLTGIAAPGGAVSLFFRMTPDEVELDEKLVAEQNALVAGIRQERAARVQAKVNARETAKVRAAACPECFATHAGECV